MSGRLREEAKCSLENAIAHLNINNTMRAREFTINIPINIRINGDGEPEIDMGQDDAPIDPSVPKQDAVMVPPLQQQIELQKADVGKISPIIKDLTQDEVDPETKQLP